MASESVSFARAMPYNRIIAFTEIYIPREWEYLEKSQGSKW
jgi:hypothetical protein